MKNKEQLIEDDQNYEIFLHRIEQCVFDSRASPLQLYEFAKSTINNNNFEAMSLKLGFGSEEVKRYCLEIEKYGVYFGLPKEHEHAERVHPYLSFSSFVKFCRVFSYILPPKTREEVFEPAFNDLLADILKAKRRHRSKLARRWLNTCFVIQVIFMVPNCILVRLGAKTRKAIAVVLPELWRRFF